MTSQRTTASGQDEIPAAPAPRSRGRQRAVLATAVGTAVLSLAGLGASLLVKSPAQQISDTAAPTPNVLTAPVEHTVLATTIVMRGTFTPGRLVQVTPVSIAPSAGNPSGSGTMVVTAVRVTQGGTVKPGQVLAEYSYRPVYALPGQVPAYRDMAPGESGPDITELQKALTQLGFPCGPDPLGHFGTGTAAAVTRFYAHLGYPAPTTGATGAQGPASSGTPSGPIVPMSEAVFLPSFPAYIEQIGAQVGDPVSKPLLTIAVGGLSLTGELDPSQQGLIKPGMTASILSEATGLQATGTVAGIGTAQTGTSGGQQTGAGNGTAAQGSNQQGTTGNANGEIPVQINPAATWNEGFDGQDVRVIITAATTSTPVLAVPEAAVFTGANTRTYVTVLTRSGTQQQVPVTAGTSADGLVEVTPVGAVLTAGEQVVVGQ